MGPAEVEAFLTSLAIERRIAAATEGKALAALLFLYRHVIGIDLPWLDNIVRAQRLPVVLSREEARRVREAVRLAGIHQPATCHTFRQCFATHLLESGSDFRTVQELMGHCSVKTTQICTHVLDCGGLAVRSPLN